jgi:putative tricarboxylic transport membrane protein
VPADTPYRTVTEYIAAAKAAPGKFKMGGTGAKQEDQILTAAIEEKTGAKFVYVPLRGGGDVAGHLVNKSVDSTVNNPIEAVDSWRAGKLRPLCVFDSKRMAYAEKIVGDQSWSDIPTCKEAGLDLQYLMLRGIFMPADVGQDAVKWYVDLFKKVAKTPEWQAFMREGAFDTSFMTGDEYKKWLTGAMAQHKQLMDHAGFLVGR